MILGTMSPGFQSCMVSPHVPQLFAALQPESKFLRVQVQSCCRMCPLHWLDFGAGRMFDWFVFLHVLGSLNCRVAPAWGRKLPKGWSWPGVDFWSVIACDTCDPTQEIYTHTHRFTVSVVCCFGWQVLVLHGQILKWEWLGGLEAVLIYLCSDWTWMLKKKCCGWFVVHILMCQSADCRALVIIIGVDCAGSWGQEPWWRIRRTKRGSSSTNNLCTSLRHG